MSGKFIRAGDTIVNTESLSAIKRDGKDLVFVYAYSKAADHRIEYEDDHDLSCDLDKIEHFLRRGKKRMLVISMSDPVPASTVDG